MSSKQFYIDSLKELANALRLLSRYGTIVRLNLPESNE